MHFKLLKKLSSAVMAAILLLSLHVTSPVFASGNLEIILTDVTESDLTTLSGEAKIKVSVKGSLQNSTIAQTALNFTGALKYKSIQFLIGENNPPECFLYSPNTALANSRKQIMPSIISNSPLAFADTTDLFILTFSGNSGESVTLSLVDLENTYCTVNGNDLKPSATTSITVSASNKANEGKKALISIIMDKVTDFTAGAEQGYSGSGVDVKITSEQTKGYTVYTVLNNTLVSSGGHRESESIPTFTVENTVLGNNTYTVEVSGLGYVPYKATGVTFDNTLKLTNADFIPGDVNADQKVDITDKSECEKAINDVSYAAELGNAADFNRDGVCDRYDLAVFDQIDSSDEPSGDNAGNTPSAPPTDTPSGDNSGNNAGGAAGGGAAGGGAAGGGAAGGGAAGGGAAGGGAAGGETEDKNTTDQKDTAEKDTQDNQQPSQTTPAKTFADLGNHSWASDAIYTLQEKGIISGVSETEYAPANNIKRGDFILILTRMLNTETQTTDNFTDVPKDSYYYDAIAKAKAAGIATGDGIRFMPENSITRQDLITLSYRAFLNLGYVEEVSDYSILDQFNDKDTIADYSLAPLASMVKAGIIKGSDNGGVNPNGYATRAEVAVMCSRLMELIK